MKQLKQKTTSSKNLKWVIDLPYTLEQQDREQTLEKLYSHKLVEYRPRIDQNTLICAPMMMMMNLDALLLCFDYLGALLS